jgi:methyl coenzyme M reductase beta subunit
MGQFATNVSKATLRAIRIEPDGRVVLTATMIDETTRRPIRISEDITASLNDTWKARVAAFVTRAQTWLEAKAGADAATITTAPIVTEAVITAATADVPDAPVVEPVTVTPIP